MLQARDDENLSRDECLTQIERLTASSMFEGSEAHCRLIRFLGERALDSPKEKLKEYQVATEGLGRSSDFDPQTDSSVRVQVGRLRNKLAEYYSSVGADDPILIEIPKGRYKLSFQKRYLPSETALEPKLEIPPVPPHARPWLSGNRGLVAIAFTTLLAFILLLIVVEVVPGIHAKKIGHSLALIGSSKPPATPLEVFWAPFIHAPEEPFVVFQNSDFVGDAATGLRRFDPNRDKKSQIIQEYTGIGEVMGVVELNQLFAKYGRSFHIKRAGLFTLDDAQNYCVIFIGFPGDDLSLLPTTHEFKLKRLSGGNSRTKLAILATSQNSSKPTVYAVSSGNEPDGVDYAIVALEKGQDSRHWKLFLEGTSTLATQAAVDFVCQADSVAKLESQLHVTSGTEPKPFEGLLRVKFANYVPMDINLVDLRTISDQGPRQTAS